MKKIVINNCYGGFGLSVKAFKLYLERKEIKVEHIEEGIAYTIPKEEYERLCEECWAKNQNYREINNKGYCILDDDIARDDPVLVKIVEELKEEANGMCAELVVEEVDDDTFVSIEEYDGLEHLEYQGDRRHY